MPPKVHEDFRGVGFLLDGGQGLGGCGLLGIPSARADAEWARRTRARAACVEETSLGGDQRAVWQRAVSSRQGLHRHRQVYSHVCLFPNKGRNISFESQPVLDMCVNL